MTQSSTCLSIVVLSIVATGCGEPPTTSQPVPVRPVKSLLVSAPHGAGVRNFPGRIDSSKRADLAFRVGGNVAELAVQEGGTVDRTQIIARLDDTDYRIAMRDRQATWDRANRDFARARQLIDDGAISRRDYDQVEASFKSADAALEQARQNVAYTSLRAPFAGQIAQRHVDSFEEVLAGQTIYSIIDRSALDVQIDVPENIILLLDGPDQQGRPTQDIGVWATFDAAPEQRFALGFKEAATRADAQTQTFQVTFSMPSPEGVTVLPGMTASVTIDLSKLIDEQAVYYAPLTAVVGDNELSARVWAVDEATMKVHAKPVSVGRMVGSSIEILNGLEPGMRIVTAGAAYLAEGMQVRLLEQTEQAEVQ